MGHKTVRTFFFPVSYHLNNAIVSVVSMTQENKLKIQKEAGRGPLKKLTFVKLLYLVTEDNEEVLEKVLSGQGALTWIGFLILIIRDRERDSLRKVRMYHPG